MFFFLFKQKTAYEMRISDWSSDVCSSDLVRRNAFQPRHFADGQAQCRGDRGDQPANADPACQRPQPDGRCQCGGSRAGSRSQIYFSRIGNSGRGCVIEERTRSEEHTSELQSLMRISYAVFCLKKKTIYSHTKCKADHF